MCMYFKVKPNAVDGIRASNDTDDTSACLNIDVPYPQAERYSVIFSVIISSLDGYHRVR